MRDIADKIALVTGAGSGIGRATAIALAREGARLALCDVNEAALRETASDIAAISTCLVARRVDVSQADDVEAFANEVHALVPAIDILVNNAGVHLVGGILDLSLDDWKWVLGVNLWGAIHCSHCFVRKMAERGAGGHVVNVSSMHGFWAAPHVIGYLTGKFGIYGFSEALRADLRPYGIGVSTVCPGMIRTQLLANMRYKAGPDTATARDHVEEIYRRRDYGPEKVARAVVRAIRRNRRRVFVSPESWLMYRIVRLSPELGAIIARAAVRRMFPGAGTNNPRRKE